MCDETDSKCKKSINSILYYGYVVRKKYFTISICDLLYKFNDAAN